MTLCCESVVNQGMADTIEATAPPTPRVTSAMGKAQQVVPIRARPRPLNNEVPVFICSLSIEISPLGRFIHFSALTVAPGIDAR